MNVPRILFLLLMGGLIIDPVAAQRAGLDFLQIGPDAASMALGGGRSSHSDDAFATFWNPAGLASSDGNSAAVSHHIWVGDVRTYAIATRLGVGERGGLGFAVTAYGSSDIEARDQPGDPLGLFSARFLSVGASYGVGFGPVRFGTGLKYLSEEIFEASANGYAFDFGAQTSLLDGGLELGASLLNLGKMSELVARSTRLPRMLRAGATLHPFRILASDDDAALLNAFVLIETSYVFPEEANRIHLGVGAEIMELVTVRGGYVTNDELRSFTLGLGLEYEPFQVDYAFVPFESGFDGPGHVMSLSYRW